MVKTRFGIAVVGVGLLAGLTLMAPAGAASKSPQTASASVIGGSPAFPTQWGTVAIYENGRFICSGTVISPTRVLTAAHCATAAPSALVISAKLQRLGFFGGEIIGVTATAVHPDYSSTTKQHDLAVLSLAQATTVPALGLPTPAEEAASVYPGAPLFIAGYGRRNPIKGRPQKQGVLTAARVTIRTACLRYGGFSAQSMLCALGRPLRGLVISRASCSGDSGGPLIASTPGGPRVVGISSLGFALLTGPRRGIICGFWKLPDIYARVTDGLSFIQANM